MATHLWLLLLLSSWALTNALIVALVAVRFVRWRLAMRRTLAEIHALPEHCTTRRTS